MALVRQKFLLVGLLILGVVSACADGSALIVGQARPAIEDWTQVVIVTEMPGDADQIAIVKASSDSGFTQQQSLDYAVDELKRQAAKVGANTVVLTSKSTNSKIVGIPTYGDSSGTQITTEEVEVVEGVAVFIDR